MMLSYLTSWLYSSDNEKISNRPCKQETQCLSCMDASVFFNRGGDVQRFSVEEILGGCSSVTLLYRSCPVGVYGTNCPGQDRLGCEWTQKVTLQSEWKPALCIWHYKTTNIWNVAAHLKWIKEVPETPCIDDVVIETQIQGCHNTSKT